MGKRTWAIQVTCKHGHTHLRKPGKPCLTCHAARNRRDQHWRKPDAMLTRKANRLKARYGLTLMALDRLLLDQNCCCAICRQPLEFNDKREGFAPGKNDYHVDHEHGTKRVRGILCRECNQGLGHFRDDTSRISAALAYLGGVR